LYQMTKQDYDNIFSFYSVINRDYSNFENIVLLSLGTLFDMHLTAYAVYKVDSNGAMVVDHIKSNSIRKEIIDQYKKKYYLEDALLKKYSQFCYSNTASTYYTDDVMDPVVFENTGYAKFIRSYKIAHQAIIGINGSTGSTIHLILVFKTEEAGDFTEREKELFQYIGRVFNQSRKLYSRDVRQQRKLEAVAAYCDEVPFGFAVLDDRGRLLQCNSAFMTYSAKLSSGLTKAEIARDLIFAVTGKDSLPEDNYFREEAHVNGLVITLQKKKILISNRNENLYFITLQKDKGDRVPELDPLNLSSHYGLTRREADVTLLVVKGYNNQEIADELFIGVSTVKTHISNIYGKLSVNSRTEMIRKLRSDEPKRKFSD